MQKNRDGGGNNAYKFFRSLVKNGNIPNTILRVELFMNAIRIKDNFCDGYQYEMQKRRDGGDNNTYKIFTSRVEEGNILSTISFMELFMTAMKMKNNSWDGYQYAMQQCQDGGRNKSYKIFTSRVEEGNISNTVSYVELFMTPMKMKKNFCNGHH